VASTPGLDEAQAGLARAPNTEYGKVLPYAEDTETGEKRLAMPDMARNYLQGLLDLISGPTTGYVSPDASMVLAQRALTTPPGEAGTLYAAAAGGSGRAAREAAAAERLARAEGRAAARANRTTLDRVIQASSPRSQELAAYERTMDQAATTEAGRVSAINSASPMVENLIADANLRGTTSLTGGVGSPEALARAAAGEVERVSTRVPTAVVRRGQVAPPDPHTVADLNIGIDALRNSGNTYVKNMNMMKDSNYKSDSGWLNGMPRYPDLPLNNATTPDEISEAAIEHMKDNLLWLHGAMLGKFGPEMVERASRWYDGANAIAHDLAQKSGLLPRQIAAAMANLSPQKDWFQNVDLAKRLLDVHMHRQDLPYTPEMSAWADRYLANTLKDIQKDARKGKNVEKRMAALQENADAFEQLRQSGSTFRQLDNPELRAMWARAYDEAYNPKDYQILTPEGFSAGRVSTNANGSKQKIAWGSFGEIEKALEVLGGDGSLESISRSLGGNHKVRSFNNNIIAPNSLMGDATMDTHAIAAGHLRALGSGDDVVGAGLGLSPGSSKVETGNKGMYAIYHEAYRRAAEQLGILPRQMQSIVWEGVRGLFLPAQKRDNTFVAETNAIWQRFRNGEINAAEARNLIMQRTRGDAGLVAPEWWTPGEPANDR
jgi:hypothetical protein